MDPFSTTKWCPGTSKIIKILYTVVKNQGFVIFSSNRLQDLVWDPPRARFGNMLTLKMPPRPPQERPRHAQERPRGFQDNSKSAQEASQTAPRALQDRSRRPSGSQDAPSDLDLDPGVDRGRSQDWILGCQDWILWLPGVDPMAARSGPCGCEDWILWLRGLDPGLDPGLAGPDLVSIGSCVCQKRILSLPGQDWILGCHNWIRISQRPQIATHLWVGGMRRSLLNFATALGWLS